MIYFIMTQTEDKSNHFSKIFNYFPKSLDNHSQMLYNFGRGLTVLTT